MSIVLGTTRLISRYPFDGVEANLVLPVTLDGDMGLKKHAQVRHSLEDGPLKEFLLDAIEYVEDRGRVSLINQRIRHVLDCWPGGQTVHCSRGPLVSVESVKYLDSAGVEQTADPSQWRADTRSRWGGLFFSDAFSEVLAAGSGVVWAEMTCGYGTTADSVPSQWKQLVKVVATHCYERRELAAGGGFDEAFERVLQRKFSAAGQLRRYG
jgi:uncharacterized phiE125 gp8 family phage protein